MKKVYVLCVFTLAAVVLDIVLFHTQRVNAQTVPSLRVDRIIWEPASRSATVPGAQGHIVGFYCFQGLANAECFVASSTVGAVCDRASVAFEWEKRAVIDRAYSGGI